MAQNLSQTAEYLFSEFSASLADGAEIVSPIIDMAGVDKWQGEFGAGVIGLDQVIETSNDPLMAEFQIVSNTPVELTFQIFNVPARQRYLRIRWQNNTGSTVIGCYCAVKATYGSSDKLSVFPLNVEPTQFSQAALVQAVGKSESPNGGFRNTPLGDVDNGNSTTTPLLSEGTWEGLIQDVRGFSGGLVLIVSSTPLAAAQINWYSDREGTPDAGFLPSTSFTQSEQDAGGAFVYLFNIGTFTASYLSISVENSATDQIFLQVKTVFSTSPIGGAVQSLGDSIGTFTQLLTTKAIAHGLSPTGIPIAQTLTALGGDVTQIADDSTGTRRSVGVTEWDTGKHALNVSVKDIVAGVRFNSPPKRIIGQLAVGDSAATLIPKPTTFEPYTLTLTNHSLTTNMYVGDSIGVLPTNGELLGPLVKDGYDYAADDDTYVILEAGGGATKQNDIYADTVDSSSGVTDPSNVLVDDANYAVFDTTADTMTISGFDGTGAALLTDVTNLSIHALVRRTAAAVEQVTWIDSVGTHTSNAVSITSPTITANANYCYIIAVSRRDVAASITSTSNTMGFTSLTLLGEATDGSESRTTLYKAEGTPTSNGTFTANFSTGADYQVITVTRLANVLAVHDVGITSGSSISYTVGLDAVNKGLTLIATGMEIGTHDTTTGYIERAEIGSIAKNQQTQAVLTRANTSSGTKSITGSYSASCKHSVVAVSFEPIPSPDPMMRITHSEGPTIFSITAANTDWTEYAQSQPITGWDATLIDGLAVTIAGFSIGTPNIEVQAVWLDVTSGTGTSRISYRWTGYAE